MLIECDICNKLDNCLIFDTGRGLIRICNKCQSKICEFCSNKDILNKKNIPYCSKCFNLSQYKEAKND